MLNDLSLAQKGCHLSEECIFQQDNAAIHNASITKQYLLEHKIRLLDHPACSPDLIPIEYLWGLIVAKAYEGDRQYSAISEPKNAILDSQGKIPSVQLQKLINSIPSRIFEVVKANGRAKKYQIKNCLYIQQFGSLVLYSCQNKILKLSINANILIRNEISSYFKFVFMPYLSYI